MSKPQRYFAKTRIAPTPSGFLHLGNVLSFVYTVALACGAGAGILLRIDDLDNERVRLEYVQDIFDTLNFLEIPWDEGPRNIREYEDVWSQRHRMDQYQKALRALSEDDKIYACNCSRATIRMNSIDGIYPGTCRNKGIPLDAPGTSWHLITAMDAPLRINTLFDGAIKTTLLPNMFDFIVKRRDGLPAYQLASVIDDVYFNIDLIVRGEDLWPSTLAQQYLAPSVGADIFNDITFHHHPLLMGAGDKKLSKSAGATSVRYLRQHGASPADVYSAIARMLGFGPRIANWQELAEIIQI